MECAPTKHTSFRQSPQKISAFTSNFVPSPRHSRQISYRVRWGSRGLGPARCHWSVSPHMRAASELLAVQTPPPRAWASGGCANDRRGHARDIQRAQCAYACGNPPTAPAPAIEAPLAAPRASPSSASHGANTGTVAARNAGAQQRRRTRTRTARFRPPSALRGAIVRRQAGISACTRVCMYTGGAAAGHASATHAGRAQQDAARAPTRRVRSRAPVPSHGVARGRGRC